MVIKVTQWNKIKAEYLAGATPKELASIYKLEAKTISNKANKEKWTSKKAKISDKIEEDIKKRISSLTSIALKELETILSSENTRDNDKISAAKAILDVSGYKSQKIDAEVAAEINQSLVKFVE